ncbi:MAG: thioredoxin family protein [Patescibacteria group bacterium]
MSLAKSNQNDLGQPAPDFSLPATDGKTYSLNDFADKEVLVITFTCNHCPYAQAAKPKLKAMHEKYKDKSIQFVAINPNNADNFPEDSFDKMKEAANQYPFPYLRDETQAVAKAYGAVCTPDIFVYNSKRLLSYHGQIDDDRPGLGEVAMNVMFKKSIKEHGTGAGDLARVLDEILAGNQPGGEQKPAMGCSIKWQ